MAYLACATFPDTDHVRDAILALGQYGIPADLCSVLWLQAPVAATRDQDLAEAAGALAPVRTHATADGPVGSAGNLRLVVESTSGQGRPQRGWLTRLLMSEGVPADEAAEIERRVLAGEVLLTVRADEHTAALEQLLGWTGAYRFRPMDLFAPEGAEQLSAALAPPELES